MPRAQAVSVLLMERGERVIGVDLIDREVLADLGTPGGEASWRRCA